MAIDSPYLTEGKSVGVGDLAAGLAICSDGYDDKMATMLNMSNSKVERLKWWWKWHRARGIQTEEAFEEWHRYLEVFFDAPSIWSDAKGKNSGALWPFYVVTTLLVNIGSLTEQEAWDMPLTRAFCYKAVIAENNGAKIAEDDIAKAEKAIKEFGHGS
jgi:hypothetical protein